MDELTEMVTTIEYYADWLETLAMHSDDEKLKSAAEHLNTAMADLAEYMEQKK